MYQTRPFPTAPFKLFKFSGLLSFGFLCWKCSHPLRYVLRLLNNFPFEKRNKTRIVGTAWLVLDQKISYQSTNLFDFLPSYLVLECFLFSPFQRTEFIGTLLSWDQQEYPNAKQKIYTEMQWWSAHHSVCTLTVCNWSAKKYQERHNEISCYIFTLSTDLCPQTDDN